MGFSLRPLGRKLWEGVTPQDEEAQRRANANLVRSNQAASQPAKYGVLRQPQARQQFVQRQAPVRFNAPAAAFNSARYGVTDFFDSNSGSDQAKRIASNQPQMYRDQQIAMGNKRPYESLGAQLVGNTARFANTADYAARAVADTISGDLDRQRRTREKYGRPDSGLLGTGTIFNSPDEMTNLGNAEIGKRVGLNTLGTASEVLPFARVARPATVAGKAGVTLFKGGAPVENALIKSANLAERGGAGLLKRAGFNAAIDTTTGAGESIARQYAQTGKVDPKVLAGDTLASAALGQVQLTPAYLKAAKSKPKAKVKMSPNQLKVKELDNTILRNEQAIKNAPTPQAQERFLKNRDNLIKERALLNRLTKPFKEEDGFAKLPGGKKDPLESLKQEAKPPANSFQDTLPSGKRPNSVREVVKRGGSPLFHDTDAKGVVGILDSGELRASQAPFSQIAGQGKRVSTTRNFDNYSRYHDSPYRFVLDESRTGQKSIPDNREEFESIFKKNVKTDSVETLAIDITNPALINDMNNGRLAEVMAKAREKGVRIEPFDGKKLPDEYANKEIQQLTKERFLKDFNQKATPKRVANGGTVTSDEMSSKIIPQSQPPKSPLTVEKTKPKVALKEKPVVSPQAPSTKRGQVDSSLNNNLFDGQTPQERFANRPQVELKKTQTEQIGSLTDDQMIKQMTEDLGISENTAKRLLAENNKPALAQNLYGSKDLIRNADSSDAYATKVMSEANKRGQAALNQNAPTKPTVTMKNGDTVDATTGEVMPNKPKNIKEFIDTLPDPKKTARADADRLIGEGTEWLRTAGREIDDMLTKNGDSYENFYRTIQQASDDVKAGKTPNVPPLYQQLYDTIKPTLDRLRKESGVETGETPYYLPRRVPGGEQVEVGGSLVDAIDAATMGSANKRTGALAIDDSDLTPESLASYATQTLGEKYRHSIEVDNLMQAAEKRGSPISMEQASEAVDMRNKFAGDLADAAEKGKDLTNDSVADLNKLGQAEGLPKKVNNHSPGLVVQSPENMLKRARIWEDGFKQYDYAHGYGNEFIDLFTKNNLPKEQFGDALKKSILTQMPNADMSIVDRVVASTVRKMDGKGIEPKDAASFAVRAHQVVAKDMMLNLGKTTEFTSNKMRKVVNEQLNGRLLNDAHEQNFLQGFDSFITERINVGLRGLNITSALFELGDLANITSNYGLKDLRYTKAGLGKIDGDTLYYSHKYGEANASYQTPDMAEVKAMDKIWADPNTSIGNKVWQSYRAVENKVLFFRYVEQHKTELFFRSAEKFYRDQGLSGGELVNRVMSDYKKTMLPHKLATANRIVGKFPKALTQYMNWGLQATKRMGRTLSGGNKAGKFGDMSRAERVARGFGTELLPKGAAAALLGIPVMQILGIRDFTGATNGDFTGIEDEEKTAMDKAVQLMSLSPLLSVGGNFYFANRRNQEADEKAAEGEEYGSQRRPEDTGFNVAKESGKMLIPFSSQAKKSREVLDAMSKGYYENRDGRIQAEAPTGLEAAQGAVFGKNYTQTMREYQDNPNIISVVKGDAKPQDLITHNETVGNISQNLGGQSFRDFNRPLSASIKDKNGKILAKGYSDMAKDAHSKAVTSYGKGSEQAKKVLNDWITNGREYNKVSDSLQRKNPTAYDTWLKTKDKDVLTPEKWKVYDGNRDVFGFEKQRKQLEKRDLGRAIDPIYELSPERANEVLQERSSFTGDDMKLRELLYKKSWYSDKFKADEAAYFDSFEGERDDSNKSDRVKQWNKMNEQVFSPEKGIITKYPLVSQYNAEIDKFENYNSQARKDFTKAWYAQYGDAYTKQKEDYDNEKFNLVNKMRKLEGVEPITFDEYKAKVEFPSENPSTWKDYGSGGGSKKAKIEVPNLSKYTVDVGGSAPKAKVVYKKQSHKSKVAATGGKPKVTIKKSMV